jgi:aryl-alcohol dehydrogenase-like predicted oxidoreductase
VTCFDTAPSYGDGHAETLLGRALEARRRDLTVVTKGGLVWDERSNVLGQDGSAAHLSHHLDASLRRLGTDYVDLYLVHWPDRATPLAETMAALAGFVQAGKARHVGVSNFTGAQLREAAAALAPFGVPLTANQVGYHLFDRRWADDGFAVARELGVGVMAYGALGHGLLAGAITRETVFAPTDWRAAGTIFGQPLLAPGNLERNLGVVDRLTAIATRLGTTLPRLALAWVLADPVVTVALVGARTPTEACEAALAADLTLDATTLAVIGAAMADAAGMTEVLPA